MLTLVELCLLPALRLSHQLVQLRLLQLAELFQPTLYPWQPFVMQRPPERLPHHQFEVSMQWQIALSQHLQKWLQRFGLEHRFV